jgi:hypothetical protein
VILLCVHTPIAIAQISSSDADVVIIGMKGELLRTSVATGDFNCDGQLDLVFGSSGYLGGSSHIYVLYGPIEQGNLTIDLEITTPNIEIRMPPRLKNNDTTYLMLDLDNDGCDDLAIGDPTADIEGRISSGQVNVLFGRPSPPAKWLLDWTTQSPDLMIRELINFGRFGKALAGGDFDGDGIEDLVVASVPQGGLGRLHILAGMVQAKDSVIINLSEEPAAYTIFGTQAKGNWVGISLWLKDFNGDSLDDILIGLPEDESYSEDGQVSIIFGQSLPQNPVTRELETEPADIVVHPGDQESFHLFGRSARLFDVDGDAVDDLLIGDPTYRFGYAEHGALAFIDGARLQQGVIIDLADRPADWMLIGAGLRWDFFNPIECLRTNQGSILWASAWQATYDLKIKNGAIYRFDLDAFIGKQGVLQVPLVPPQEIYTGANYFENLGRTMSFADLDASGSYELIFGASLAGRGGEIFVFFDQFEVYPEPLDDDDDDDDSDDDTPDVIDTPTPFVIKDKSETESDFLGGCRCF